MTQETQIPYEDLTRQSLLDVVRRVLVAAAKDGLPGQHHFYLAFRTTDAGVQMSDGLRQKHPSEMTIVLQHQFWDLVVKEEGFSVTLSFGGQPEKLYVPFNALTAFLDPSVQFGLQFKPGSSALTDRPEADTQRTDTDAEATAASADTAEDTLPSDEPQDNVIALDGFRKR